jgi:hypothetical protein
MDNPPPSGSVWEAVEQSRLALRWSARAISTHAGLGVAFYARLAARGWNAVDESRDAILAALVAAGIPPTRFVAIHPTGTKHALSTAPNGRLSAVRDALYAQNYPEAIVDRVVARSTFIALTPVDELQAFLELHAQVKALHAPLGRMDDPRSSGGERERFDRDAKQLAQHDRSRRRVNARK